MNQVKSTLLGSLKGMVLHSQISAAYPCNEPFKITLCYKLCLVYQFLVFSFYNIASLDYVRRVELNSQNSNDNILKLLTVMAAVAMTSGADINFTMILLRRPLLTRVFGRLEAVDVRLNVLGCRPRYSSTWKFCVLAACPFGISIALVFSFYDISTYPFYLIVVSGNTLAAAGLSSGILYVLAEQLRCLRTQVASSVRDIFGIVVFSDLHGCATVTCQLVGRVFANQMFTILVTTFIFFVINIHYFLQCVYFGVSNTSSIVIRTCWTYAYIFLGYRVVNACASIQHEVKEFNILLYHLMINDSTNEVTKNKKLRLHIAMKREVVFTAFGYFNLDYSLVHSMIAAATTYLTVLIQFNEDPEIRNVATNSLTANTTS